MSLGYAHGQRTSEQRSRGAKPGPQGLREPHLARAADEALEARAFEHELRALDGVSLAATSYDPPAGTEPRAALVLASGTAIPQRFYRPFALHLASHGIAVSTFDYRGVARSKPALAVDPQPRMRDWAHDAHAATLSVARRWPGVPRVYLGHSFGGQALGLVPDAGSLFDAAVLVTAGSGWRGHWPAAARPLLRAYMGGAFPLFDRAMGKVPGWAGMAEDLPGTVALEWARWCAHPEYMRGVLGEGVARHREFARPLLALSFSDDFYAPPPAVKALLSWYERASIEHRAVAPAELGVASIGHFGLFRPQHRGLWNTVASWVLAQT